MNLTIVAPGLLDRFCGPATSGPVLHRLLLRCNTSSHAPAGLHSQLRILLLQPSYCLVLFLTDTRVPANDLVELSLQFSADPGRARIGLADHGGVPPFQLLDLGLESVYGVAALFCQSASLAGEFVLALLEGQLRVVELFLPRGRPLDMYCEVG